MNFLNLRSTFPAQYSSGQINYSLTLPQLGLGGAQGFVLGAKLNELNTPPSSVYQTGEHISFAIDSAGTLLQFGGYIQNTGPLARFMAGPLAPGIGLFGDGLRSNYVLTHGGDLDIAKTRADLSIKYQTIALGVLAGISTGGVSWAAGLTGWAGGSLAADVNSLSDNRIYNQLLDSQTKLQLMRMGYNNEGGAVARAQQADGSVDPLRPYQITMPFAAARIASRLI